MGSKGKCCCLQGCCCFDSITVGLNAYTGPESFTVPLELTEIDTTGTSQGRQCNYASTYLTNCSHPTTWPWNSPGYFGVALLARKILPRSKVTPDPTYSSIYVGSETWKHNIILERVFINIINMDTSPTYQVRLQIREELFRYPTVDSYTQYGNSYFGCDLGRDNYTTELIHLACEYYSFEPLQCASIINDFPSQIARFSKRTLFQTPLLVPVARDCNAVVEAVNSVQFHIREWHNTGVGGTCKGMPISVSETSSGMIAECFGNVTNPPIYSYPSDPNPQLSTITFSLNKCSP